MKAESKPRSTRRGFVGAAAGVGGTAMLGSQRRALATSVRQETTPEPVGEAATPEWRILVVRYQDPYPGTVLQPQQPEEGMRYVGVEVEIRNESDRPLAVSPGQVRLRDADAIEYGSGGVVGSDPRLFDVNMLPGERVRGWVWFGVPEGATAAELVYVPPAPQLRIALGEESGG